jgi:sporulation protein YlmC with PRC-barrel domain
MNDRTHTSALRQGGRQQSRALLLAATLGLLVSPPVWAADAVVTDVQGNRVEIQGVQLSYDCSTGPFIRYRVGGFGPVCDSIYQGTGLKLYQGEGQVMVEWSRILKLTIRHAENSKSSERIPADMILRGDPKGEAVPVDLVNPREQLIGSTILGRFSILIANVATVEPLATTRPQADRNAMRLTGLTVTDRKGVAVTLKVPEGMETPWLWQGAGSVTIPFNRVSRIEVKPADAPSGPTTMLLDIDGQGRMQFALQPEDLKGETNLGAYTIPWSQVANVVTSREKNTKK